LKVNTNTNNHYISAKVEGGITSIHPIQTYSTLLLQISQDGMLSGSTLMAQKLISVYFTINSVLSSGLLGYAENTCILSFFMGYIQRPARKPDNLDTRFPFWAHVYIPLILSSLNLLP
jgi:hypothetical protein